MYNFVVDLVKRGVLTFVGEIRRHGSDRCYHYSYQIKSIFIIHQYINIQSIKIKISFDTKG